jgi:GTP-binding protein
MKSIIAIIGRPNVGKSTLFNRLTGKHDALIADKPGVTRDRLYGTAISNGHSFILIDTGGLHHGLEDAGTLEKLVTVQALQAACEADAVIWMVDGREGLTTVDEELAAILRSQCQRLYLAVNKSEGLDAALVTADFHKLGGRGPFAISAQRGSGIKTLMDAIFAELPAATNTPEPSTGLRITVLGRPNVGKSTLVNRMLGEERMITYDQPGTTRDSVVIPFERNGVRYTLIDTAGVRRRARILDHVEKISVVKALQAIDYSEVVILVVDAQDDVTEQDSSLLGLAVESGKGLIIAVNKWDGLDRERRDMIRGHLERRFAFVDYACIHFISALYGSGVGDLFDTINRIGKSIAVKASASRLTEVLHQAVIQHAPPLVRGRRIKLRYAHTGGHNPLRIIVHGNQVKSVPDAYRRYLAHTYHRALRLTGTPVFIEFRQGENPYQDKRPARVKRKPEKKSRKGLNVKRTARS